MRTIDDTRSSLSLRRLLIELNIQLEAVKNWTDANGRGDALSTLRYDHDIKGELPILIRDILLLEDRRFFHHRGFEFRAIPRGFKRFWKYGKFGGVSTIDQLLVRTYLLRNERTISRKIREIFLATLLNFHKSKYNILLAFVNCAYFGPRMNGADTASNVVFGLNANQLSLDQSAFISSLLPYPVPKNVAEDLRENGPKCQPNQILHNYAESNPWWVSRIEMRSNYVKALRLRHSIDGE